LICLFGSYELIFSSFGPSLQNIYPFFNQIAWIFRMSNRFLQTFIFGIAILLSLVANCPGQELTVYTEDYKPFQYKDAQGLLTGFGVELVKKIFAGADIEIKRNLIRLYPWARAYAKVLKEKNTAVFMTVRTRKREPLFKWVGPLAPRVMWLYKLKKRKDIQLHTLADVKRYKVGGYNQSADTIYLLDLGFNVHIVPAQRHITKMLVKERIELMPSLELTMAARLSDLGLDQSVVAKTILLDDRYDYHLAINSQTANVLVNRLQESLDQIKQNGDYARLWSKYAR